MLKLNQRNNKNKVKNTQQYLPNPPKMGPKSIPGTLLGAAGENMPFIASSCFPNGRQRGSRWTPQITKNQKKSRNEAPKSAPQIDT